MTSSENGRWLTRRRMLRGAGALAAAGLALGGYGFGVAPFGIAITRYALTPPRWPSGFKLRIAALSDLHVCEPWTGVARLERIVAATNALEADVIVMLGDYMPGYKIEQMGRAVPPAIWGPILGKLRAPGGVHAVLGNHDWWEDADAQRTGKGPTVAHRTLGEAGIVVHENTAARIAVRAPSGPAQPVWIAGLGDQWAFFSGPRSTASGIRNPNRYRGVDDFPTLRRAITDDAPAILLIHEPDFFGRTVDDRCALTLAGHTHGGQVRLGGYAPIVPSRYGNRYAYGHIVEAGRHMIVSSGLGVSGLPVRLGAAPEIILIELG
jgi:uncharacterized protein